MKNSLLTILVVFALGWACGESPIEVMETDHDVGLDAGVDAAESLDLAEEVDAVVSDAPPWVDGMIEEPNPEPEPEPEPEPPPDPPPMPEMCAFIGNCGPLDSGATEHRAKSISGCAFRLMKTDRVATAHAELDGIAAKAKGYVSIDALNFNRIAQAGVTAQTADRLKNHDYFGFRWNSGDMTTVDWYPQGMTGNLDSGSTQRKVLVSWYDKKNSPAKGVRISVADLSNPNNIRYRHILLVQPNGESFGPVVNGAGNPLHAGGIVWFGNYLYVADTGQGFRVFDLSRIIEVTHTDDNNRIGVSGSRVDAFGYRYIAGQIARYRQPSGSCPIRFSFAGLDRSTNPPLITTGEYIVDSTGGRLARWPIDPQTGWLIEGPGGVVQATDAFISGQTRMQGAFTRGDEIYISSSSQYQRFGRLYRTKVGQESKISAWVYGAEDLYYETSTNRIWTPAEHPNARDVVSIPRLGP